MITFGREPGLDSAIAEILSRPSDSARKPSPRAVKEDFHKAARQNYAASITDLFDREEMSEILSDFQREIPAVNKQIFRTREPKRLARVASDLGARLVINRFEGESGRVLRGFYINDSAVSDGPLICLNGASHPTGVAAAFWHEVGHHLTSRVFGVHRPLNLSFSKLYEDHLTDPIEIAADVMTALAAYPLPVARRLFARFEDGKESPSVDDLVQIARGYLRSEAKVDFRQIRSTNENLQVLAGIMHVIRLRWVLFSEYNF